MRMRARSASGLLDALGLGYDLPVGQAVYAIDAFPDDDLLWRIEWIGGVGYNTRVPSEPQIDFCLAQLPKGEKNPLSARARSPQVEKRTVKFVVGLLPYVWIGSVWQKRRPVITNLSAYRGRVSIDATSLRMVALGMGILNLFTAFCQASSGTDARSGVQAATIWDARSGAASLTGIRSSLRLPGCRAMIASKLS